VTSSTRSSLPLCRPKFVRWIPSSPACQSRVHVAGQRYYLIPSSAGFSAGRSLVGVQSPPVLHELQSAWLIHNNNLHTPFPCSCSIQLPTIRIVIWCLSLNSPTGLRWSTHLSSSKSRIQACLPMVLLIPFQTGLTWSHADSSSLALPGMLKPVSAYSRGIVTPGISSIQHPATSIQPTNIHLPVAHSANRSISLGLGTTVLILFANVI
jgi:hypothetical protein